MNRILEAIMCMILTRSTTEPAALPTGPNPMPDLSEFLVERREYQPAVQFAAGSYRLAIDVQKEVGFFEHVSNLGLAGQFWLAGHVVLGGTHLLPREVRQALETLCYEVA